MVNSKSTFLRHILTLLSPPNWLFVKPNWSLGYTHVPCSPTRGTHNFRLCLGFYFWNSSSVNRVNTCSPESQPWSLLCIHTVFLVCTTHENKQLYESYFANLFVYVDQFDSKQKNIQTVQTVNFHVPQLVTGLYQVILYSLYHDCTLDYSRYGRYCVFIGSNLSAKMGLGSHPTKKLTYLENL